MQMIGTTLYSLVFTAVLLSWDGLPVVSTIPAPPTTTLDPSLRDGYFPNPQKDQEGCGNRGRPSWVCDTTKQLDGATVEEADRLIWMIRNTSNCPCSQTTCRGEFSGGYKIGVAVIKSFSRGNSSSPHQNELLGKGVSDSIRLREWKMGACEEDIVVLMVIDDGRIYMSVGALAQRAFIFQCELEVGYSFMKFVREKDVGNYDRGLILALQDIKASLLDHRQCVRQLTVVRWWHMVILGSSILLVMIIAMFAIVKLRNRHLPRV